MTSKKITTIVGARPQFIKASPVSRALQAAGHIESIIHTGQHSDANMSEIFFEEMAIPQPKYFLGVSGLTHGAMTGDMLGKIEQILINDRPDAVLVYGDTNSTLAGALAAAKLHIPIAHVEAGLRSFNLRMPEEINRTLTDRISHWLFCPTSTAVKNLKAEGFGSPTYKIDNVGDVMLDATRHFRKKARWPVGVPVELQKTPFVLCTVHRQESIDDPKTFDDLLSAFELISKQLPVVWPVHPRARKALDARGARNGFDARGALAAGVHTVAPVSYLEMLGLLEACAVVATDSGGLQKEAFFFEKYCLTLRTETEWTELVEIGANALCGTKPAQILSGLHGKQPVSLGTSAFGDGHAAEQIAAKLLT